MRRIFLFLFTLTLFLFLFPQKTFAACQVTPDPAQVDSKPTTIKLSGNDCTFAEQAKYLILACPEKKLTAYEVWSNVCATAHKQTRTDKMTIASQLDFSPSYFNPFIPGKWFIRVCPEADNNPFGHCKIDSDITAEGKLMVSPAATPTPTPAPKNLVKINVPSGQCKFQAGSPINLLLFNAQPDSIYRWWWDGDWTPKPEEFKTPAKTPTNDGSIISAQIPGTATNLVGTRLLCVDLYGVRRCSFGSQNSVILEFTADQPKGETSCVKINAPPPPTPIPGSLPCLEGTDDMGNKTTEKDKITECTSVDTAVGGISTDPAKFVGFILKLFLGLAGGIALLLIISSGYRLMASQGNPEKIQEAKEVLTAAIVGLLFIIFSLVLLQTIGVDILQIPGFSK